MPVKATPDEYELKFIDGPAEGQVIKMFVYPTKNRWFCRRLGYTWWSVYEPPADHHTEIFKYKIAGYAFRREGGAAFTYELVSDD